jgi:hypothetical protein
MNKQSVVRVSLSRFGMWEAGLSNLASIDYDFVRLTFSQWLNHEQQFASLWKANNCC